MYSYSNGSRTLPRTFRYEEPHTPEPPSAEPRQPSPPRQRLKVRRRNDSSLQAPTQQFLASVAAADVPVPTIELAQGTMEDLEMPDRKDLSVNTGLLAPLTFARRAVSPPKTPMPVLSIDLPVQRPNWTMGSPSPAEEYFSRPGSSLSDGSDFSDDSFYSGSRISRPSDDGSCTSPESDSADPFQFPMPAKGNGRAGLLDADIFQPLNGKLRSKSRKDAPWTQAQSAHLWCTYIMYLQDPTVTPFRISASAVPPEGVCYRVARESRRSWKGQKIAAPLRRSSRLNSVLLSSSSSMTQKSGSNTPTVEYPKSSYAKWPHSGGATRNHLRAMCRKKDNTSVSRHRHLQSRSPTPFTKLQWRLRTPEHRPSAFNTKDIALSLTTSTAESMQPDGPLAQLSAELPLPGPSSFPPLDEFKPLSFGHSRGMNFSLSEASGRRLGSPFVSRTYGPSSSQGLDPFEPRPSPSRTQSDTNRQLRSPLRIHKPHSLNGTQKRRAQHDLEEELSPSGAIVRPSILNEQLFGTPLNNRRVRSRGFSLGDEALRNHIPGLFRFSPPLQDAPKTSVPQPTAMSPMEAPKLLPSATFEPSIKRLGSPFSELGPSNTFPRRVCPNGSATIKRSAFATVQAHQSHQTRHSIESFDFGDGPSLQSRLQNLDSRLKQIREREEAAKQKQQQQPLP
ncbi:uncharacterized protein RAG0_15506 [Rhynchosporium agropyri]|uniref:Uncharacterized protein n=1 Tax=Rhynchosporium agropyri TaxID=914238 RepID=A0A1E1LLI3_9HELO|nr:uncharacterized protein RAG0_15506 [Rhynchosporium agropyri]